jgi:hypothetical protein
MPPLKNCLAMPNKKINNNANRSLWNTLSEAKKEELLVAYEERLALTY